VRRPGRPKTRILTAISLFHVVALTSSGATWALASPEAAQTYLWQSQKRYCVVSGPSLVSPTSVKKPAQIT
jgi:hypothetical protein